MKAVKVAVLVFAAAIKMVVTAPVAVWCFVFGALGIWLAAEKMALRQYCLIAGLGLFSLFAHYVLGPMLFSLTIIGAGVFLMLTTNTSQQNNPQLEAA